jgi:arabinan endo-1,5-alpha-L-arabinosidase
MIPKTIFLTVCAALALTACAPGGPAQPQPTPNAEQRQQMIIDTRGENGTRDPAIARDGDRYYLFGTGAGIPIACSPDLVTWKHCGRVFEKNPKWITIPGVKDLWAPDIALHNGRYYLYYSASTFGSNLSAIGLATNTTLNMDDPAYRWEDQGLVFSSDRANNYNAIDPNLAFDAEGTPWLAFGSFWSGIKLVRLEAETLKPAPSAEVLSIAQRPEPPDAIEGAFILPKDGWYYLFVSHDLCCRGILSTYNIRVGRASEITGPYADRDGQLLTQGGGSPVVLPRDRWKGTGHNSIFSDGDRHYIVYHFYDAENAGKPTLRIEQLFWNADGWPVAPSQVAD